MSYASLPSYLPRFPGTMHLLCLNSPAMSLSALLVGTLLTLQANALPGRDDPTILRRACPDYTTYASTPQ